MEKVRATKARSKFQEIIDKVHYTEESMIVTKHGKPWVLVSPLPKEKKKAKKTKK
ncbi:MAG: type II toxin-antitoxin system prevent-host-death family antitoxin [Candidatus Nealsonbacteria bacterium]|nr:type II toxin-antitoxin system prevent-host-death family antitoxin [Candidatus Nealsonbacteria bacterium]